MEIFESLVRWISEGLDFEFRPIFPSLHFGHSRDQKIELSRNRRRDMSAP